MSDPTPIYTETLREAKRRTRRHSEERRDLLLMDARTEPKAGRSSGPHLHFDPPLGDVGPAAPPSAVQDLQAMGML